MRLNNFQYELFKSIVQIESTTTKKLAKRLNTNIFKISKNLKVLKKYNLVVKSGKFISVFKTGVGPILARFILEHPETAPVLANAGLPLLRLLEQPQTLNELTSKSGLSEQSVYRYLRKFLIRGMIIRKAESYQINKTLWLDLESLVKIINLQKPELSSKIPVTAKVYFYQPDRIIFSTNLKVDASLTAFSKYSDFGLPILEEENIYRLPYEKLKLIDIFLDSLECLTSIRRKIICALFYLKHREKLKDVEHPQLDKLKQVLKGEVVEDFPSLEEITRRAEMYDIELR